MTSLTSEQSGVKPPVFKNTFPVQIKTRRTPRWVLPTAATILILIFQEWLTQWGPLAATPLPPFSVVITELAQLVITGDFWIAVGLTLQGWGVGLVVASLVAVPFGLLLGTTRWLYLSFKLVIDFLRPIPSIALLPLFILIMGMGMTLKIWVVAIGVFFPMLFQTLYGVQDVDPVARDTARAYRITPIRRFFIVEFMGATPYIATGVRLSASVALVVAVAVELLVGVPGVGAEIFIAQNAGNVDLMYAWIVATGLLGLLIAFLFIRLEKATMHWHASQRGVAS
jgi:ABC-type nitrate/sulfonate/bicarbonate transport system permease component